MPQVGIGPPALCQQSLLRAEQKTNAGATAIRATLSPGNAL